MRREPDFDDFADEDDEPAADAPPDNTYAAPSAGAFEDPVESYTEPPWEYDAGGED